MNMKTYRVIPGMILVFSLLLLGCSSSEEAVREGDTGAVITTLSEKGVTITAQYLDAKMLFDRFGTKNNPFFEYRSGPVIVISFNMASEQPVRFRLSKVEIRYLGAMSMPIDRVTFGRHWEEQLRSQGVATTGTTEKYRGWSYSTVLQRINGHVLPDTLDISPGGDFSGYLLFPGEPGRRGVVRVLIPIYSLPGEKLHEFIFLINV
jgi:hypothetical protein